MKAAQSDTCLIGAWGIIFRLLQPVNSKQKFISLKRVRNKFLRAAKRVLPAIDRLAETKSFPVKPQKGKKYLMGKYFPIFFLLIY